MELKGENYRVTYDPITTTITCEGSFRLRGQDQYGPIENMLTEVAEEKPDHITLDVKELEFLNSSGINMLSKFVIKVRRNKVSQLVVLGSHQYLWQDKSLLDMSPSTLGRRIKRLEAELKTQLFVRTTRKVNITEAGQRYFDGLTSVLAQLESIESELENDESPPSGLLRVSIPNTFGRLHVAPCIAEFMNLYPDVSLEITQNDSFDDLMLKKLDVAIRIGQLSDSTMKAKKISPNIRRLVASKSYVEKYGYPRNPEDLTNHRCLHFAPLQQGKKWLLTKGKVTRKISVEPRLTSDDASALFEAAIDGSGIALLADFITREHLETNKLIEVLPDWTLASSDIYAIYPNIGYLPKKTRVFIDFFTAKIRTRLGEWLK